MQSGHSYVRVGIVGMILLACAPIRGDEPRQELNRTVVEGGIVRGDANRRAVALVFTADTHGEGTASILDTLCRQKIHGSFFLTGAYLRNPRFKSCVRRMVAEGHYVGPHSHGHLLYCPWDDRQRSLIREQDFKSDLQRNLTELQAVGVAWQDPIYFIPPFEWYNAQHSQWARELGCVLFTFTPGSGLHRDWMPESHPHFRPSTKMLDDVLEYDRHESNGLHGHILPMHLGAERKDKMYRYLDRLVDALRQRGYAFVTVDQLLGADPSASTSEP